METFTGSKVTIELDKVLKTATITFGDSSKKTYSLIQADSITSLDFVLKK